MGADPRHLSLPIHLDRFLKIPPMLLKAHLADHLPASARSRKISTHRHADRRGLAGAEVAELGGGGGLVGFGAVGAVRGGGGGRDEQRFLHVEGLHLAAALDAAGGLRLGGEGERDSGGEVVGVSAQAGGRRGARGGAALLGLRRGLHRRDRLVGLEEVIEADFRHLELGEGGLVLGVGQVIDKVEEAGLVLALGVDERLL
mmetsp:Transcript_19462/g.51750  ORF Transcript_19462/g.51750 Transcript_19462/m.51750 type:complete len:201 (+) Transcript_19462:149-751(+)